MKILLLGKDGQLGRALQPVLAQRGTLAAFGREGADLTSLESLDKIIRREAPQIIVNAAAYTAVDQAEVYVVRTYWTDGLIN